MLASQSWFRRYGLYSVVGLIALLLAANIYLMYLNNQVIQRNKSLQEEAERIKVSTLDLLRNLHLFDMTSRSYALLKKERFYESMDTAVKRNDQIFKTLEQSLKKQNFPMNDFQVVKDSINDYFDLVGTFRGDLISRNIDPFIRFLDKDPGYNVWFVYTEFSKNVTAFEDKIATEAKREYTRALQFSYILQLLIFIITIPTLAYTAYYTVKALGLSDRLRQSEKEKNKMLAAQNELLERRVSERTNEILAQNEEIAAQNEEISSHNEQLVLQQREIELQHNALATHNDELRNAKQIIEEQNQIILQKNNELMGEVSDQTEGLKKANLALIEQNSRLQQFAYIISHNLRAPLARLVGLTNIFEHASDPQEAATIINMMVCSANGIDEVIKDLAFILEIQKQNTQVLTDIDINAVIAKIALMLESEITETKSRITTDIPNTVFIKGLPQYVESILYNLISNAIKYRDPVRRMEITISSSIQSEEFTVVEVTDNGLGIDLEKYSDKLFMIYKRFHSHVEGKGLGLYLVKTQVAAMGGKIEVSSKPDAGTTFTIYFKK